VPLLAVVSPGLKPFQDPVPPRPDVVSFEIVVILRLTIVAPWLGSRFGEDKKIKGCRE
jgi:hypothetical protein